MATARELERIHASPESDRARVYSKFFESLVAAQSKDGVCEFLTYVVKAEGETPFARINVQVPVLLAGIARLLDEKQVSDVNLDPDDIITIMKAVIPLVKTQTDSLAQVYYEATRTLAAAYEACEEYGNAAVTQSGFNFGSLGPTLSSAVSRADRARWHIRTAELYLKPGVANVGAAQLALQQAAAALNEDRDRSGLTAALWAPYTIVFARVSCQLGRLLGAASAYCQIADMPLGGVVTEARRTAAVQTAVLCVCLAPLSSGRTRLLTKLHADPRALLSPLHSYMEKVLFQRIVSRQQVAELLDVVRASQPHLLAVGESGRSLALQSSIEHNIAAASRVYKSIGLESLAELVGCGAEETERLVVDMVGSGQLDARLDQVDGLVWFGQGAGADTALKQWNRQIAGLCKDVAAVHDAVVHAYPKYAAQKS